MIICSIRFLEALEEHPEGFFLPSTLSLSALSFTFLPPLLVCMDALAFDIVDDVFCLLDGSNVIPSSDLTVA